MANDTTGNPWKLDTAATLTTAPIKVKKLKWAPTTDAHDILVEDNAGHDIWSLKAIATTANAEIVYESEPGVCNGFKLTTIDSGVLYVYQ